jgi:hypothetical protein
MCISVGVQTIVAAVASILFRMIPKSSKINAFSKAKKKDVFVFFGLRRREVCGLFSIRG